MGQDPLALLRTAIRQDHERTGALLGWFRRAWLDGESERAELRFHRFRCAMLRHLDWEECSLLGRFQDRALDGHEIDAVAGDCAAHRELRAVVGRIEALLPDRSRGDRDLDRRILELVEALGRALDAHCLLSETRLCDALGELITPAQCEAATREIEGRAADPD